MDYRDYKTSEATVRSLTGRVQRRLLSIGQSILSFEDIEQELWIAWCIAVDRYDPDKGIPWKPYLIRGMKQHINRQIEKHLERFEGQTFALSLDSEVNGEEGVSLGSTIESNDPIASEVVEQESSFNHTVSKLSPRAQTFVQILHKQPRLVVEQVLVAQDKAEFARKIGAKFDAPRYITSAMVFNLMGANASERARIKNEIRSLSMDL